MFKHIYENTISQIEATRQREIDTAKQKVMQEKILPFNRDIETSLREALSELQQAHTEKIAKIQQSFEAEKEALNEAAVKRKESYAESAIAVAVKEINETTDTAIAKLKKIIDEGA